MPIVFSILIIIVIILCSVGIVFINCYNKINKALLKLNNAEINIDEELRNVYDLLIKAINIIEKNNKNDIKCFNELKKIKSDEHSNFEINRILINNYNEIIKINEDDAKLNNNKIFKGILNKLNDLDEKLIGLRTYYNKYTYQYNILLKTFPSNIIGFLGGYRVKNQYDGKDLNDNYIKDFKI